MCALRRRLAALALAGAVLGVGAEAESGGDCSKASQECDKALEELSQATRDADSKASAYVACTEGRGPAQCVAQKKALEAAMTKKRRAQDAYRFAAARKKAACR